MLYPETKNGGDRKSEKIRTTRIRSDFPKSFVDDTAEKMQVAPRTVEKKIQIARELSPEVKTIVKDHGISEKNSLKLARIKEPEKQKEAAEKLAQGHHKATTKLPQQRKNNGTAKVQQSYSKNALHTRYIYVTKLAQK